MLLFLGGLVLQYAVTGFATGVAAPAISALGPNPNPHPNPHLNPNPNPNPNQYDAVTFPGATLGFAYAGQLTIFHNNAETRNLYQVVENHVARGFKSYGDAQSGWEERDFLRDTLRVRP